MGLVGIILRAYLLGVGMDGVRVLLAVENTSDVLVLLSIFIDVPFALHGLKMLWSVGAVIQPAADTLDARW
jgi:hypothetical protein